MIVLVALLLSYALWRAFTPYTIHENGDRYLRRWTIARTKWFRVFLHRIYRADKDRHLHNHPWPSCKCLILNGGYYELRIRTAFSKKLRRCFYAPGDVNTLQSDVYHRIAEVLPNTWTLVFAGRRSRSWGFLVDGKHIDWKTYLNTPNARELND